MNFIYGLIKLNFATINLIEIFTSSSFWICPVTIIRMQINIVLVVNWSSFSYNACIQSNVKDHEGEVTYPERSFFPLFLCVCLGLMIIISAWNLSGLHEIIRSQKGVNTFLIISVSIWCCTVEGFKNICMKKSHSKHKVSLKIF